MLKVRVKNDVIISLSELSGVESNQLNSSE